MLNFTNNQFLTVEQRRSILSRALHSQPFYHILNFELLATDQKKYFYRSKVSIDKDFWITGISGNFGEVLDDSDVNCNLSLYLAQTSRSLWNFTRGLPISTGFQTIEARFNTVAANQKFVDIQDEICPFLVNRGDSVQAQLTNVTGVIDDGTAKIVLAGYNTIQDRYIGTTLMRGINDSLADDTRYETWVQDIQTEGIRSYTFKNDRFARIVLGFGVVDTEQDKGQIATCEMVSLTDSFRSLRWNNEPIPIEFLAPRLTCLRDTHMNYLPMEYLLEPFAPLRFELNTTFNNGSEDGLTLVMFTRTV